MRKVETDRGRNWMRMIGAMALGALLYAFATQTQLPAVAGPQQRAAQTPAYRSGAERSLEVLREISATLKRIDGRMENWERMAKQANQRSE